MKDLLALLLLAPAIALAEKPTTNPADFTVAVHVQSSHIRYQCSDVTNGSSFCLWNQELSVTIAGKKYELTTVRGSRNPAIIHAGDYKAKVLKEDTSKSDEYQRSYELMFPDGQVADFQVTGEPE